jgi:hypothetical protein
MGLLLCVLLQSSAAKKTEVPLQTALALVEDSRFEKAIPALRTLLSGGALSATEARTARVALAKALFYTNRLAEGQAELRRLFTDSPDAEIDAIDFAPDFLQFFQNERKAWSAERPKTVVVAVPASAPASVSVVVPPPPRPAPHPIVKLIPFGVGQFAGGDAGAGAVFCAIEVALLATNLSTFALNRTRFANSVYQRDAAAPWLYWTEQVSGGLFYATLLLGVLDAFLWSPQRVARLGRVSLDVSARGASLGWTTAF